MNTNFKCKHKLLVITSSSKFVTHIKELFTDFIVYSANSFDLGMQICSANCQDVIFIDVNQGEEATLDFIHSLRTWFKNSIIIFDNDANAKLEAAVLNQGADDYLVTPKCDDVIIARTNVAIRNHKFIENDSKYYKSNNFEIDLIKRKIRLDDSDIHVSPVEYKILETLALNAGKVVTYSTLLSSIWGPYMGNDSKILRVNMANIRRKIENDPTKPKLIHTVTRVGYRINENEY